jgi:hypothetical protein
MVEYSKIIAITGLPGLYELISSKSDGGIVRSLEDKSTRFVSSRVHQFSHLESIEVYTTRHNENLATVLKAMEASGEKLPDEKDPAALKAYFEKLYPELDHSRVYNSDLRKMVKWFSILRANQVEIKLPEPETEPLPEEPLQAAEAPVKEAKEKPEAKPAKKAAAEKEKPAETKKPVKKAASEKEKKETAEKTAKKTPAKKAATKETPVKKSAAKESAKKTAAKKKSK